MERRVFLKGAVTTCGVVVVGLPNLLTASQPSEAELDAATSAKTLHYHGDPRSGCATPWHRHNQHDGFPQDPHKLNL